MRYSSPSYLTYFAVLRHVNPTPAKMISIANIEVIGGSSANRKKANTDAKSGSTKISVDNNVGDTYLTA